MTLTFLTMPVSTNNMYAHVGKRRFLTQRARTNKEAIAWEARAQYRGKPLTGPLAVTVAFYWPTRRNHDIENAKGLFDACTGILWQDDGLICDLHITKEFDKGNPRVVMTVREVPETEKRQAFAA